MKKLLLTITMAITGLGGLATSAQAHPWYHGYHYGYHYGVRYNYCWHGGRYGYWNWDNGYRFFVVVPGPYWVCP